MRPCSVTSGNSREMDSKLTMNRFSSAQVFSCGGTFGKCVYFGMYIGGGSGHVALAAYSRLRSWVK